MGQEKTPIQLYGPISPEEGEILSRTPLSKPEAFGPILKKIGATADRDAVVLVAGQDEKGETVPLELLSLDPNDMGTLLLDGASREALPDSAVASMDLPSLEEAQAKLQAPQDNS